MTQAIASFGTLLKIGDGGTPENFTTIAEVQDISGPSLELDVEEVTSHDSPGGWEEVVGTILHGGEVEFDINFVPTATTHRDQTGGLLNDMKNRTKRNFKLVFPDAGNTTWSFSAYVVSFEPEATVDGKLSASVTLRITGQPTLA